VDFGPLLDSDGLMVHGRCGAEVFGAQPLSRPIRGPGPRARSENRQADDK
jgi:hypothetical protein